MQNNNLITNVDHPLFFAVKMSKSLIKF